MELENLPAEIQTWKQAVDRALRQRIVGQAGAIEHLLTALLCNGHCLFVGVPGLAKTLLVQTLAEAISLKFNRIQFTPDLMPSDITGSEVFEEDPATGKRTFRFIGGPLFSNLVLADEINRTPPKTQSALLQAMQERNVTVGGVTHELPAPFLVFATQNPIEQEGTYPLPEAQLDRFTFLIPMTYPSAEEEAQIVLQPGFARGSIQVAADPARLLEFQHAVEKVPVAPAVAAAIVRLARATRPGDDSASEQVRRFVRFGAGPRAAQHLAQAARARCLLLGRGTPDGEDVLALAQTVLSHRIVLSFNGTAEGIRAEDLVGEISRRVV